MLALPILAWALLVYGEPEEGAVLAKLHDVYLSRIRPVERKFRYPDLGRGTVTEQEIYAKPIVTLLRPGAASNAVFNLLLDDHQHLNNDDRVTILETGSFHDERDLPSEKVGELLPVPGSGPECKNGFRHVTSTADLLEVVTVVDIPFTSRFIDREYRKSCADTMTNIFRKTDLFILVLSWDEMKIPHNLVHLLHQVDPEQSEVVVVITDFKETLKPDVAEAYREVLWMLQPFFPRGGAPEVFLIPLHESDGRNSDAYIKLQRESLHKKLWSLRERTVNLKVNRIFRYARQIDDHISTLQRYLEAYVSRNEELIRELTTDPRKFGVFDECDSTCQRTQEYQRFFSVNPIQDMARLLDDCKKLRYSAAAVERSFMEELLPVAARAKLSTPSAAQTTASETTAEQETTTTSNNADASDDTSHETENGEYGVPTFETWSQGFEDQEDTKQETEQKVEKIEIPKQPDDGEDSADDEVPASVKADEQDTTTEKSSESTTEHESVAEKKISDQRRVPEEAKPKKKPAPAPKPSNTWAGAEATPVPSPPRQKTQPTAKRTETQNSKTPCKFRKNCVEDKGKSQGKSFGDEIWKMLPSSIREAAAMLPFDTDPFFEQAEQLLGALPDLQLSGLATSQGQERSWCKFRSRCRKAMEKTGKVPEEFKRLMRETMSHTEPPSTVASLAAQDAKASCKYRKSCSEAAAGAAVKDAKSQKFSKETKKSDTARKQDKKAPVSSDAPKSQRKEKQKKQAAVDTDDPKCRFHKSCKAKLDKKKAREPPASRANKEKPPPATPRHHRPYSTAESDEKCRFRKSCKGQQPEAKKRVQEQPKKSPSTESKTPPKPKSSRPYLDGKVHKCQFSKSCDPAAKAAARAKAFEKPQRKEATAPTVIRPYMAGGAHKCPFSKTCNTDEKAARKIGQKSKEAPLPNKPEAKAAAQKPTAGSQNRPYVDGRPVKCRFSKTCDEKQKKETKASQASRKADKTTEEHPAAAQKVRPYMQGGLHKCQFSKSCDAAEKAAAKVISQSKAIAQQPIVDRPYVGETARGDSRFRKSCKDGKIPKKESNPKQKRPDKQVDTKKSEKRTENTESRPADQPKASKPKSGGGQTGKKEKQRSATEELPAKDEQPDKSLKTEKAEQRKTAKEKTVSPKGKPAKTPKPSKPSQQRPYVGDYGEKGPCRFRKSCPKDAAQSSDKKRSEKPPAAKAAPPPTARPYGEGDTAERHCRFRKSCDSEKAVEKKTKKGPMIQEAQEVKVTPLSTNRPYTAESHHRDCRFMKSCSENTKRKQKKQEKQETKKQPVSTPVKSRPYSKQETDDKCQFRKSCKDDVSKKKVVKQASNNPKSTQEQATVHQPVHRPYVGAGHVKCQFSKSCDHKEQRKTVQPEKRADTKGVPSVDRPYSRPVLPGQSCRFRKSCTENPSAKRRDSKPSTTKQNKNQSKESQTASPTVKSDVKQRKNSDVKTSGVAENKEEKIKKVQKLRKTPEPAKDETSGEEPTIRKEKVPQSSENPGKPQYSSGSEDHKDEKEEKTKKVEDVNKSQDELKMSARKQTKTEPVDDAAKEEKPKVKFRQEKAPATAQAQQKTSDEGLKESKTEKKKSNPESADAQIQSPKPAKPQFSKSSKKDRREAPPQPARAAQVLARPYGPGDPTNRKCQFRKSCDKEKLPEAKAQQSVKVTANIATSRPYVDDKVPRPCRFRKSCDSSSHEQATQTAKECRFRKCGNDKKAPRAAAKVESGPIFDTDESGISIFASARDIAAQAFSSLFSPSRPYPLGGVNGGELDEETILEYQQMRRGRNRTGIGHVLWQIVGAGDNEYGCNVFHKRCRLVLGMPPLKASKIEKTKKKCRRRKKKQS